jgi:hypothetical protein
MPYDLFTHNDGVNERTCKVVLSTSSLKDASEYDTPWERDHDVKVELYSSPLWVDITLIGEDVSWWFDLAQHGCESGMYMPAVTYHEARDTFKRYGAEMLDYLASHDIEWHEAFARKFKGQAVDMDHLATFVCSLCIEMLAVQVVNACEEHGLCV